MLIFSGPLSVQLPFAALGLSQVWSELQGASSTPHLQSLSRDPATQATADIEDQIQ